MFSPASMMIACLIVFILMSYWEIKNAPLVSGKCGDSCGGCISCIDRGEINSGCKNCVSNRGANQSTL